MDTYIVTVTAKPGHEKEVAQFYKDLEPLMQKADGFHGRKIYQARTGSMAAAVRQLYSAEELAKHAEPPHEDPGTQFVMIEFWDSIDHRMQFSKGAAGARNKDLIPHLLPVHSHEFYEDISAG